MRTSIRPWVAVIGILPLTLALSGCFGMPSIPNLPGTDADDDIVEQIVEGQGDGVDFEADALPADFPVADIPLVDGEPGAGFSVPAGEKKAWQVVIVAPSEAAANEAGPRLEAAGFTFNMIAYENDAYLVIVSTAEGENGTWQVSYLVSQQ